MIENVLRLLMLRTDTIASVIGERCYFAARPQNERRASVVLSRVSTNYGRVFEPGQATHVQGRTQLDVLAATYHEARELATTVRNIVDTYTSDLPFDDPRAIVNHEIKLTVPISVDYVEVTDERDLDVAPLEGQQAQFGVSIDAAFQYQNS